MSLSTSGFDAMDPGSINLRDSMSAYLNSQTFATNNSIFGNQSGQLPSSSSSAPGHASASFLQSSGLIGTAGGYGQTGESFLDLDINDELENLFNEMGD